MSLEELAENPEEITADEPEIEGEGVEPELEVEDDVVVTIGDEDSPPQEDESAAPWVKDVRKTNREQKKRIKELEAQISERTGAAKAVELGAKPTLEGADYDEEKFASDVASWHERKRAIEAEAAAKEKAETDAQSDWNARLETYRDQSKTLGVKDYSDAEDAARDVLTTQQQGILIQGMENPALVIYALGKNPQKASEMAAITDPVRFAVAAAKLETTLKVSKRSKPQPEGKIAGSAPSSGMDSTLEKLEAEADRTGDRTKVLEYKRRLRAAEK